MKTLYIVLTFCLGLFAGYLIFPGHTTLQATDTTITASAESKLHAIDTSKQVATVKLQLRNNELAKSLISISALLADNKEKLASEREKVLTLTSKITCKDDSLIADSLQGEIAELNCTTDSIIRHYEQKDSVMHCEVAVRDSQIVLCDQSYNQVKDLLREQEQRELQLTRDLDTALKENKRTRFRNKVLAAATLFISGLATTLYIKSK